ncbi:MAG TPA: nuclear transport factor 2 family protein [Polyangiaceae bacterium]|jgi:hypothetical protein
MTTRPTLQCDDEATIAGTAAVEGLVEELQAGLDRHDADLYDRRFAENVLWGSPFGATVYGYEPLHDVHARFQARGVGASSRFVIERIVVPAPDVAIAQVRRVAPAQAPELPPAPGGIPNAGSFSEMAMYVLIRKDERWWLAAGQNTPIRKREARHPTEMSTGTESMDVGEQTGDLRPRP